MDFTTMLLVRILPMTIAIIIFMPIGMKLKITPRIMERFTLSRKVKIVLWFGSFLIIFGVGVGVLGMMLAEAIAGRFFEYEYAHEILHSIIFGAVLGVLYMGDFGEIKELKDGADDRKQCDN